MNINYIKASVKMGPRIRALALAVVMMVNIMSQATIDCSPVRRAVFPHMTRRHNEKINVQRLIDEINALDLPLTRSERRYRDVNERDNLVQEVNKPPPPLVMINGGGGGGGGEQRPVAFGSKSNYNLNNFVLEDSRVDDGPADIAEASFTIDLDGGEQRARPVTGPKYSAMWQVDLSSSSSSTPRPYARCLKREFAAGPSGYRFLCSEYQANMSARPNKLIVPARSTRSAESKVYFVDVNEILWGKQSNLANDQSSQGFVVPIEDHQRR